MVSACLFFFPLSVFVLSFFPHPFVIGFTPSLVVISRLLPLPLPLPQQLLTRLLVT